MVPSSSQQCGVVEPGLKSCCQSPCVAPSPCATSPAPAAFPAFPFQPYPIQLGFMQQLYQVLEQGGVGLLESPTGTGKTLSIICSALQWLLDHRSRQQQEQQAKAKAQGQEEDLPDWVMEAASGGGAGSGGRTGTEADGDGEGSAVSRAQLARSRRAARAAGLEPQGNAVAGAGPGRSGGSSLLTMGAGGGGAGSKGRAQGDTACAAADWDPELDQFCLDNNEEGDDVKQGGSGVRVRRRRAAASSSSDEEGVAGARETKGPVLSPWEQEADGNLMGPGTGAGTKARVGQSIQVIFCSRTHSQLSQFVSELRRTPLPEQLSVLALAGRKVLCVHEPVLSGGPPSLINERCTELQQQSQRSRQQQASSRNPPAAAAEAAGTGASVGSAKQPRIGQQPRKPRARHGTSASKSAACPHLAVLSKGGAAWEAFVDDALGSPLDVEELARAGAGRGVCPYYASRRLVRHADLLLLPYASLLSHEARETLGIRLEGAVVIFDEAHNLVDAVNSSHSCSVSLPQLRTCQRQLSAYWSRFSSRLAARNAQQLQLLMRIITALMAALGQGQSARGQGATQGPPGGNGATGPSPPAPAVTAAARVVTANDFVFDCRLESVNLLPLLTWTKEVKLLQKVAGYSQTQEVGTEASPGSGSRAECLSCLHTCTAFLSALTNPDSDGRVLIVPPSATSGSNSTAGMASSSGGGEDGAGVAARVQGPVQADAVPGELRYVLLNAASHFAKVLAQARSVVLASGTLSPVQGILQQLFPSLPSSSLHHYQCGHIVPRQSLVAMVASKGPSGLPLSLTHQQRSKPELLDEVGRLLLNVCTAVPDGVVAFVPSFSQLELLVARWTATGLITSLEARKQVFREPRGAAGVEAVLQEYASCIAATRARRQQQQEGGAQGKAVGAGGQSGALLLSVVGAKLSEGINFGDELGRCVVVLGMPYADPSDPELRERMAFLDRQGTSFTGRQYYEDLCMKAVNQCIGRVIRHKDDYAAVVLADARYLGSQGASGAGAGTQGQGAGQWGRRPLDKLPGWMLPSLVDEALGFGQVMGRLHQFFRSKRDH